MVDLVLSVNKEDRKDDASVRFRMKFNAVADVHCLDCITREHN